MSIDTRLDQVVGLLSDAEALVKELMDDGFPFHIRMALDGVRFSTHEAHRRALSTIKEANERPA